MGFDVLYFPPIHPIGRTHRKGRNNSLRAEPDDPGSPYAIGAAEGGHDAIHPQLGTLDDFRRLRDAARGQGLELALDFAIQCSPDHPWLRAHPGWFAWRPDGSVRYAENPPKKYEDIVNVDFYAASAKPALWLALRDVVMFWAAEGVRLFRVDNPHTKPLPFWEWMIGEVRARYPDAIFLSEAFTRPKVMYRLAKVGFSQSYTYFTWRHGKQEFIDYLTELTRTPVREYFRPHFFVNTPDINPVFLQTSGRPGFLIRAALAATLSGLWGVYNGFELCEGRRCPARRNTWTPKSTSCAHGTTTGRATSSPRSRCSTASAAPIRRCIRTWACSSSRPRARASCTSANRRRRRCRPTRPNPPMPRRSASATTRCWSPSASTRITRRRPTSSCRCGSGACPTTAR